MTKEPKVPKISLPIHGEPYVTQGNSYHSAVLRKILIRNSLVIQALLMVCHPDRDTYSIAGRLCMDQLMSLRHRGAFSTVAQTFLTCCNLVRGTTQPAIRDLINEWYKVSKHPDNGSGTR